MNNTKKITEEKVDKIKDSLNRIKKALLTSEQNNSDIISEMWKEMTKLISFPKICPNCNEECEPISLGEMCSKCGCDI